MLDLIMYSNFKYVKEEILPTNNDMFIALYHGIDLICFVCICVLLPNRAKDRNRQNMVSFQSF